MLKTVIILNLIYFNYFLNMPHYPEDIEYSDKYQDDFYEYRHVILPKHVFKKITKGIYNLIFLKENY